METYFVTWIVEVDAESPEQAAELAHKTKQDPDSDSTFYMVRDMWGSEGHMIEVTETENHNDTQRLWTLGRSGPGDEG